MEISSKVLPVVIVVVIAILADVMTINQLQKKGYEEQITKLQNDIASKDKTIEVQKGVYEKLTIRSENISKLLDAKDQQVSILVRELVKNKEQLLTANSLVIKWKNAYTAEIAGHQTDIPSTDGGVARKRVDFEKDFGYIGVEGHTITDPPEAFVKIQQNRPLKISLIVSQDKDGVWKTRAASSEDNVGIDITLAAVNPQMLDRKWYENISVSTIAGVSGDGVLAGISPMYEIGNFAVGPAIFATIERNNASIFYGLSASWRPFWRQSIK